MHTEGKVGRLTTHVLDTSAGRPAKDLAIRLYGIEGDARHLLVAKTTNADGRCDGPLLEGAALRTGTYELVFDVAAYFRAAGVILPDPPFLDAVPIRFGIAEPATH